MNDDLPRRVDPEDVKKLYQSIGQIYRSTDKWNRYSHKEISKTVRRMCKTLNINSQSRVLNAGSAGDCLGLEYKNHFHVDIVENNLYNCNLSTVSNVENLPFKDSCFELVICVGSVINYCDAAQALSELSRVIVNGGHLIVEYDKSESFEFILSDDWGQPASIITTFYDDLKDTVWVYSENYISGLMQEFSMHCCATHRIHLISPLVFKLTAQQQLAANFAFFDKIFRALPYFKKKSCSAIQIYSKI